MSRVDLEPAGQALLRTAARITEQDLERPTPCEGVSVGQLVHHVVGLT